VRDVEGELTVEEVADDLSALADTLLDRHRALGLGAAEAAPPRDPGLAVIAYGKLGGKELGYGSDLDVVFVYDDSDEPTSDRAQEVYAPSCASSSPG
jgi:glutamate-ammonia-ligase adenylyltransferase